MIQRLLNKLSGIKVVTSFFNNKFQNKIFAEYNKNICFQNNLIDYQIKLSNGYGKGLPERVIELLYASTLYFPKAEVLDIGHSNSTICHRKMLKSLLETENLSGIDIAKPTYNVNKYYKRSIIADIVEAPFQDNEFDLIWCISAMEHFGMDNSGYLDNYTVVKRLDLVAVKKMLTILKPEGKMLITVPYGKYEDHKWFINYDEKYLKPIIEILNKKAVVYDYYYRHTYGNGWFQTNPEELRNTGYYDQSNAGSGGVAVVIAKKMK